jgi:hypothetical protein
VKLGQVPINILSDDALLYVFDFYVAQEFHLYGSQASRVETWHALIHVCQRWRTLVFASPRRLNLRIACTSNTPREKLDVWPALPIVIFNHFRSITNIKAVLAELHDRVYQIELRVDDDDRPSQVPEIFAALEAPFPVLTDLRLRLNGTSKKPILPNPAKFLGRSTHLRSLWFSGVPVPILPELLSSSTNLVDLHLDDICIAGLFSIGAMVTALSTLTRLKVLHIGLEWKLDQLHLDWKSQHRRHLPLPPRAILPSLTTLESEGFSEYLEDLMARIDAPLLDHLNIAFIRSEIDPDIEFDTPQLLRFISRIPKLQAPDKASMAFDTVTLKFWIDFSWTKQIYSAVRLAVHCRIPERWIPRLVQFCHSPFFPFSTLEYLYICGGRRYPRDHLTGPLQLSDTRWLEIFQPFTAVKNLYLSEEYARHIAPVLQRLGALEVFPTLEKVFLEFWPSECVHEAIEQFAAARKLSGHPIVISTGTEDKADGESPLMFFA